MRETERAAPKDPILQGDIVEILDSLGLPADPPYGIVINADCDLAHCKTDGVISYVPAYPFTQYFLKFWLPSFIETRRRELLKSIVDVCAVCANQHSELELWIRDEDPADITKKLSQTYSVKLTQIASKINELSAITKSKDIDWNLLLKLVSIQGQQANDAIAKFSKIALKNLGEGQFFINEICNLETIGFVVRLRRIYSLPECNFYATKSNFLVESNSGYHNAIRVSRLTEIYKFKLAQIFAHQFSRIGLPDELTELNEIAVQASILALGVQNA